MGGFPHRNNLSKSWLGVCLWVWFAGGVAACGTVSTASPAALASPTLPPPALASPLPLISATPELPLTPSPLPSPSPTPFASVFPTPSLFPTPTLVTRAFCSPLGGYSFDELPGIESQPFIPPRPGKDDGHHGVDFAHWQYKDRVSLDGAAVQSVFDGVVAAAVSDKYPYGNMIIVETTYEQLPAVLISPLSLEPDQSLYLLYAHLKKPSPYAMGDPVACGATIGIVGNTGASGNPHLHLETRTGPAGVIFESMEYYKTTSTAEERTNYERWRFLGEFTLWNPWEVLQWGED